MAHKLFFLHLSDLCGFSAPAEAGLDALTMVFPAGAPAGEELVTATFVHFSREAQEAMQMQREELIEYAKSTFLATSKPAECMVERRIGGLLVSGQHLHSSIPVPSILEVFLLEGPDGACLVLGLSMRGNDSQPADKLAEKIAVRIEQ